MTTPPQRPQPVQEKNGRKWYRSLEDAVNAWADAHNLDGAHPLPKIFVLTEHHSPSHVVGWSAE